MNDMYETAVQLIKRADTSFISSVDAKGFPNTKAMLPPRGQKGLKDFLFSTNTSSMRVAQFRHNGKTCLYFYDRQIFQAVMLQGMMEVDESQEMKDMLWLDGDEQYYPLGVSDPDYCVLKFTSFSARYYNGRFSHDFLID